MNIPITIINAVSQAFVMSQYLQNLYLMVGKERYFNSPIRYEHGTGKGFFGVSNTGSTDCIKERFRKITDGLGLKFDSIDKIYFRSESCRDLKIRDKGVHRIEHTYEIKDMYIDFEKSYIMSDKTYTPQDIAVHIIENQVVCLIEQKEQKVGQDLKHAYRRDYPFTKYSSSVFYNNENISHCNKNEIIEMNQKLYAHILSNIVNVDFKNAIEGAKNKLISPEITSNPRPHSLPPESFAIENVQDEMMLLKYHYHHKLMKRTTPSNRWFGRADALKYANWNKNLENACF